MYEYDKGTIFDFDLDAVNLYDAEKEVKEFVDSNRYIQETIKDKNGFFQATIHEAVGEEEKEVAILNFSFESEYLK